MVTCRIVLLVTLLVSPLSEKYVAAGQDRSSPDTFPYPSEDSGSSSWPLFRGGLLESVTHIKR